MLMSPMAATGRPPRPDATVSSIKESTTDQGEKSQFGKPGVAGRGDNSSLSKSKYSG